MATPIDDATRRWVGVWQEAGRALEGVRREELARLTEARALAAARNLFALAGSIKSDSQRWSGSGLVLQQALFHGLRGA